MEKVITETKRVIVDEFELVHTLKNVLDTFSKGDFVEVPVSGSKSKHIRWNVKIIPKFKVYPPTTQNCNIASSQFRVEIRGKNDVGGENDLYAQVDVILSNAARHDYLEKPYREKQSEIDYHVRGRDKPYELSISVSKFSEANSQCTLVWDDAIVPKPALSIIVQCKFTIFHRAVVPENLNNTTTFVKLQEGLRVSFEGLLISEEFADVTIVTPNGNLYAHKALLAARCPVFRAMFSTDMVEASNNKIEIVDFDREIVFAMLQYIYTGFTDEIYKNPQKLLQIADKYDLKDLREVCASKLSLKLTVGNAISSLLLADRHDLKELKKAALKFLRNNQAEISKCDEFESFVKSNTDLYMETLRSFDG